MASACGNDHCEIVFHGVRNSVDVDHSGALFNAKELVAILMDLLTDFVARLQGHRNQLKMMASVEDSAEILVLEGPLFDIVAIALHGLSSFRGSCPQFIKL